MFRLNNVRHVEGAVPLEGEREEALSAALAQLHGRLMSPVLDLSQADIHSLDGSPGAARPEGLGGLGR
jgi:hypothetical protein